MSNLGDVIRLDLPANHRYLSLLSKLVTEVLEKVQDLEEREQVIYGVQLAVQEVCTNVVNHAYHGSADERIVVSFELMETQRCLIVHVTDNGTSFDITQAKEVDLENPHVHGYGLYLIHQLMDDVIYEVKGGSNYWQLVKYF